jgi:hypothetical protein
VGQRVAACMLLAVCVWHADLDSEASWRGVCCLEAAAGQHGARTMTNFVWVLFLGHCLVLGAGVLVLP